MFVENSKQIAEIERNKFLSLLAEDVKTLLVMLDDKNISREEIAKFIRVVFVKK
jgi:hypothetical protein